MEAEAFSDMANIGDAKKIPPHTHRLKQDAGLLLFTIKASVENEQEYELRLFKIKAAAINK